MTTETRNEAAEHHPDCWAPKGYPCSDLACGANAVRMLLEDIILGRTTLTATLAAERRATVERIRDALAGKVIRRGPDDDGGFWNAYDIRAILDEEAAR